MFIPDSIEMTKLGLGSDEKPYLGSPSVVEGLLRDALANVILIRERQLSGENLDWKAEISKVAVAMQDIFYGRNDVYRPSPWNSEKHLGVALVDRAGIGGSTVDAVFRLMLNMFGEALTAYSKFEADENGGDDEFVYSIDDLVVKYVSGLVGARYS